MRELKGLIKLCMILAMVYHAWSHLLHALVYHPAFKVKLK